MANCSDATAPLKGRVEQLRDAAASVEETVVDVVEPVAEDVAETTAAWLRSQPWMLPLTRAGWVAKALVYATIGWAAMVIAIRWSPPVAPESDATYTGIVALLADQTWSRLVLLVVAMGLLLYVAFRLVSVLLIDCGGLDGMAHRIGYAFSAATYAAISWAAFAAAISGRHEDEGSSLERYSADLLTTTLGRMVVGLGAIGALGLASYFMFKGLSRRFVSQLDLDGVAPAHRRFLLLAGAVGWVGRAIVVAAVAIFLLWAAVQADPGDARGLDRALHRVAFQSTVGTVAVFATGVLLLAYALFCLASAPYRSLAWSDRHDPDTNDERRTTSNEERS